MTSFSLIVPVLVFDPVGSAAPLHLHDATGGGRCVGAVEHHSWNIRLLPHQRDGGEDPHTGKCPVYPPICDRSPVGRPHPAHDIYTVEKTLTELLCLRPNVQERCFGLRMYLLRQRIVFIMMSAAETVWLLGCLLLRNENVCYWSWPHKCGEDGRRSWVRTSPRTLVEVSVCQSVDVKLSSLSKLI